MAETDPPAGVGVDREVRPLVDRLRQARDELRKHCATMHDGDGDDSLYGAAANEIERLQASERSAWNAAVVREQEIERLTNLLQESSDMFHGRSYGKNARDEYIGRLWTAHAQRVDATLARLRPNDQAHPLARRRESGAAQG